MNLGVGARLSLSAAASVAAVVFSVAGFGCWRHGPLSPPAKEVKPAQTGGDAGDGKSSATSGATSAAPEPGGVPGSESRVPNSGEPPAKPKWAGPVKLAGVGNCYKVSDSLYRGEQPTPGGFRELKKLGIKTVVNLRAFHSDADEIEESGVEGFETVRISFKTWHAEDEDVVKFLKTIADPAKAPVFVHCMHGSDRTGLMCAIYRTAVEGWSKDDALEEMTKGPYGFHSIWKNLPAYFKSMDVEKLRKEAGMAPAPPTAAAPSK